MVKTVLWRRIAKDLERKINAGVFHVGDILPTEMELMKTYRVGRDTMRKAILSLAKDGLLQRTQHVGTRVTATRLSEGFSHEMSSLRAIDEYGNQYPRAIQNAAIVRVDETAAHLIGVSAGTELFRFENFRFDPKSNDAVVVTFVYVAPQDKEVYEAARAHPYELMVSLVEAKKKQSCTEVRQSISATYLPAVAAKYLKLPERSPALRIVRRYLNARGELLVSSVSYHPADVYTFSFSAKRKSERHNW